MGAMGVAVFRALTSVVTAYVARGEDRFFFGLGEPGSGEGRRWP